MSIFEQILTSLTSGGSAVRLRTDLQPIGGIGDKVMPVTYSEGEYATEPRKAQDGGFERVLLDSVQSQANRMEEVLLSACRAEEIKIPLFYVEIKNHGTLTTLDVPHRIHDAIFRDCVLDGKPFQQSDIGVAIKAARTWNATALYQYAPTALLFGTWDSTSEGGVTSAKIARALVSEIVASGIKLGAKTSSRIDPLGIRLMRGIIYKHPTDMWTLNSGEAVKDKDKPVFYGKKKDGGKPSVINHGNVAPTVEDGGVTFESALQTTVLSLSQLRRLCFPEGTSRSVERDNAGRAVLAALGIFAVAALREDGYQLRSRCQLLPTKKCKFEIIGQTAEEVTEVDITRSQAIEVYEAAVENAERHGLAMHTGMIKLEPSEKLLALVDRSDKLVESEDE